MSMDQNRLLEYIERCVRTIEHLFGSRSALAGIKIIATSNEQRQQLIEILEYISVGPSRS